MALASDPSPVPLPSLDSLITSECRELMRVEIARYNGSEVFFIGRVNKDLIVDAVETHAYGNRRAVPALLQYARPSDVVIHNHPSGHLEPSDADISVSSELGSRGVGSYIVNNDVNEIRIVVKPFRPPGMSPVNVDALSGWLKPGGRIAERMEGYEHRPQQIDMLKAVTDAFNHNGIAMIEAGTGTGKSMAYLLPAIAWALKNNERVVISTGTINLQEQILEKDLPLLREASGLKFEAALLKGRANYLGRRKTEYLRSHPDFFDGDEKSEQMNRIYEWMKTTPTGSLEDLGFVPDGDVWERMMSEADNCLRAKCPTYQTCFFYNARRRAANAQILIVNHNLLLADLALRADTNNYTNSAVLPPYSRLIIDEAHNLEEVATSHFALRVARSEMRYNARRLISHRNGNGVLKFIANRIHGHGYNFSPAMADDLLQLIERELPQQHADLLTAMDEAAEQVAESFERDSRVSLNEPLELKRRITPEVENSDWWADSVVKPIRMVLTTGRPYLEGLSKLLRALSPWLEDGKPEDASPILELRSSIGKLEQVITRLARFIADADGQCRWIEYRRRPNGRAATIIYCVAPLDISDHIREKILRRMKTVVLTSATMTVENKFDYQLRQLGADDPLRLSLLGSASLTPRPDPEDSPESENAMLGELSPDEQQIPTTDDAEESSFPPAPESEPAPFPAARHFSTMQLATPFDYERQVYICVPRDLPEPNETGFERALFDFLGPTLEISRGRAFVLFTAYSLLQRAYNVLAPRLEENGYPCLRQGDEARSVLTETFRRQTGSILFATSSFWEGVDVQGDALSCLVLTRLPFKVPGEPLAEARIEAMRARGVDPFMNFVVPQAVIKFRQGFGRLIRSRNDRGAVLICDNRLFSKRYGRMFLNSLPSRNVHHAPSTSIFDVMQGFFNGGRMDDDF